MSLKMLVFLILLNFHRAQSQEFELKPDQYGHAVIAIDNFENLKGKNTNNPFIPASVTKLLTALYALKQLGPEFQFSTQILSNGTIKNGILIGDLTLVGSGDPYLTFNHHINLCMNLKKRGIQKVQGNYYFDDSQITWISQIDQIGLEDQAYNSGISGLGTEFNRFKAIKENGKWISLPKIPQLSILPTDNVFPPGLNFRYSQTLETSFETWLFSNTSIATIREQELPIRAPGPYTANSLAYFCKMVGVELPTPMPVPNRGTNGAVLAEIKSLPLSELMKLTLEYSNNLFAETLLMVAAQKDRGKMSSLAQAASAMTQWLKKEFPDLDWSKIQLHNGSGLSSNNFLTPQFLAQLLAKSFNLDFDGHHFISMLSISGQTGFMARRLQDSQAAHQVWAKTGSLDYVTNIAGFFKARSGRLFSFTVFVTDHQKRKILDGPLSVQTHQLRQDAPKWKSKTENFTDQLIGNWIRTL